VIVVSDASVLINLDQIGQMGLLRQIYDEVLIPAAVSREVMARRTFPFPDWIQTKPASNRTLVLELCHHLDPGESEAIALAIETGADLLLIDERHGRRAAMRLGVKITGLLGVLLVAKHRTLIHEIAPHVMALREAGFWLAEDVVREVLRAAKEL
jgi:predicted nucleic acid-binding protein